jgi:hypothetical protein
LNRTIQANERASLGSRARRLAGLVACFATFGPHAAFAQEASPEPSASPPGVANCALVGADEISQILGYTVTAPDEASSTGGICFFPATSISEEGSASYALVDAARLQQRKAYYAVLARKCAGVQPGASHEFACKTFVELAQAKDVGDYFKARTDFPNAEVQKGLGDSAIVAGDALYVKRGDVVYEVVVKRGDALDVDRSTTLAKRLLSRTPAPPPTPEPSPSPRRPKPS